MKKVTIAFVTCTVIVVCVVILFLITLRDSSTNPEYLPKLEINNSIEFNSYCRTKSCVIATSKLDVRYL